MNNRNKRGWNWKSRLIEIFENPESRTGRKFYIVLFALIVFIVIVQAFGSIGVFRDAYWGFFFVLEWVVAVLFTVEVLLRIIVNPNRFKYIFSFYGLVDLLSLSLFYISLGIMGANYYLSIRVFRLFGVFNLIENQQFKKEFNKFIFAIRSSLVKLSVFFFSVLILSIGLGIAIYLVESGVNYGYTSIPAGVEWALGALLGVDTIQAPATNIGRLINVVIAILNIAIIVIPVAVITAELITSGKKEVKK